MSRKLLRPLIPIIAAAMVFAGCTSHNDGHKSHEAAGESKIKVPDRAADIFAESEKHLLSLGEAIKAKDARAVHEHDVAVRDLIGAIPQRAAPDIKDRVNEHVREISDAAKSAHAAAHDDDWAKAETDVKRAQDSLKHLRSNFKETSK